MKDSTSRPATFSSSSSSSMSVPFASPACSLSSGEISKDLETIDAWVDFRISSPTFLDFRPFALSDLQAALERGVRIIVERLDPELNAHVDVARDKSHRISICQKEMYATRTVEWDSILPSDIIKWEVEVIKEYLKDVRAEIRWMKHEIRRLKVHMENAEDLIKEKLRCSFAFHPTSRETVEQ